MKKLLLIIITMNMIFSSQLYADICIFGNCENGYGSIIYNDGENAEVFRNSQVNRDGKVSYADGTNYIGQFKNGLMNGEGTVTYADGTKYIGQFRNGLMHGQGTFYKSDGSIEKKGLFLEGLFIDESELWTEPVKLK